MPSVRKKFKRAWLWWLLFLVAIFFLSREAVVEFSRWQTVKKELAQRQSEVIILRADIGVWAMNLSI